MHELLRLAEHTWAMTPESWADRPSLGYVRGRDHALMIDAGNSPAHHRLFTALLRREGLPDADMVMLTHSHWDHTFGLCSTNAEAWCLEATQARLEAMSRWAWTWEAMLARVQSGEELRFCHDCLLREYDEPGSIRVSVPAHVFQDEHTLDLGGVHVRCMGWPSSHTEDCAVALVEEDAVLFLGDITYMDLAQEPPCRYRGRHAALLERLHETPFVWAVPGHQCPMRRNEFFETLAVDVQAEAQEGMPWLGD